MKADCNHVIVVHLLWDIANFNQIIVLKQKLQKIKYNYNHIIAVEQ